MWLAYCRKPFEMETNLAGLLMLLLGVFLVFFLTPAEGNLGLAVFSFLCILLVIF